MYCTVPLCVSAVFSAWFGGSLFGGLAVGLLHMPVKCLPQSIVLSFSHQFPSLSCSYVYRACDEYNTAGSWASSVEGSTSDGRLYPQSRQRNAPGLIGTGAGSWHWASQHPC